MGHERHCGCGFELLLDVTVPPMGGELVEVPNVVSQVVEQNVDIPVHGGMEYISPEPAAFQLPEPAVEYLAPGDSSVPIATASRGVHLTRTSWFSFACSSGGVYCTRAGCVSFSSASCGAPLTCASCPSLCEMVTRCCSGSRRSVGRGSRSYVRRTRPLRSAFEAHCRRFGLQESQVRFSCDGLLSSDHSPGQLGLEDGDVTEAEEVFEEDEEQEEEEDEGTDEIDGDRSSLVSRVLTHLVLCSPRCRQACLIGEVCTV